MKKYITILFLTVAIVGYSQGDRGTSDLKHGIKLRKDNFKGHGYLLNDWVSGFAVDLNGKLTEEKLLNYDIYQNKLTFKKETASDDIMVITTSSYSGFMLSDEKTDKNYLFTKLEGNKFKKPKKVTKFYEIVSAPSKNVIMESVKILKDPNASGWSSSRLTTKNAEFALKTYTYVLDANNKYAKVSVSKGSLLKVFKDKKKEVSEYIKSNNISINDPSDMVAVVDFYHSL